MSRQMIVFVLLLTVSVFTTSALLQGLCMGQYCFGRRMYLPANYPTTNKRSADWMTLPGAWMNRHRLGEIQRYVAGAEER